MIDWAAAIEIVGSKAIAEILLEGYVTELPEAEQKLIEAFNKKDKARMAYEVHKLSGATAYCGLPPIQHCLKQIQQALKSGEEVKVLLQDLMTLFTDLKTEYRALGEHA